MERRRGFALEKRTADDGVRTRDLRFTKPLLYQLSYVGKLFSNRHLQLIMRSRRKWLLTLS
jgi:hypothetical protein